VDKSPRFPLRTETDAVAETFCSCRNTSRCSVSRNPVLTRWLPLRFLLTKNTVNSTVYEDSLPRTGIPRLYTDIGYLLVDCIGGCTILKWISEIGCNGVDWIDLTQDRDQWRALVNAVMNLWVP
jgi:hypothetical protein